LSIHGTATVANSTITGNSAGSATNTGHGGGIANSGTLTVTNSTITGNTASGPGISDGGGISNVGTLTLVNTIVAGNAATNGATGPDIGGNANVDTTNSRNNLIGTGGSGGLVNGVNGNQVGVANPGLGPLGDNGGPTQTIPLLTGSPAIAHGNPAACAAAPVNGRDQRAVGRPVTLCAIGAFEPLLSAIAPTTGGITGGTPVTLTGAGYGFGTTVTIGGVPCTNLHIVSSTTLTCTTGAHAAGAVDVVVTVFGQTGALPGGYTYALPNPLPGLAPPGGVPGSPSPLPGARQQGGVSGAPNPLPSPRP
jgi:hypothetical protein